MSLGQIDTMVDFAIAQISGDPDGYRTVVRDLVVGWPEASGLQVIFVLVSAVNAIERVYPDGRKSIGNTEGTLKMAALLGTDLYALEQLGVTRANGHALLEYWDKHDPFFLNL